MPHYLKPKPILSAMNYQIIVKPQVLKIIPHNITHSKDDKYYAFDMDGTLIQTKGKSPFPVGADDWKWLEFKNTKKNDHKTMFSLILSILKKEPKSKIVIFSNQSGIRPINFGVNASFNATKTSNIQAYEHMHKTVFTMIDKVITLMKHFYEELAEERVFFYCSLQAPLPRSKVEMKMYDNNKSKKMDSSFDKILKKKQNETPKTEGKRFLHDIQDCQVKYKTHKLFINQYDSLDEHKLNNVLKFGTYRKPGTGMLREFYSDVGDDTNIDYFVGDAAGRTGDFSDSDKVFAKNAKLQFHTPETLFSLHVISDD